MVSHSLRKQDYLMSFEQMVKNELEDHFNELNKAYISKGLWWRVVPGHYWIEMRIDHSLKEDIDKIQTMRQGGKLSLPIEASNYDIKMVKNDS